MNKIKIPCSIIVKGETQVTGRENTLKNLVESGDYLEKFITTEESSRNIWILKFVQDNSSLF